MSGANAGYPCLAFSTACAATTIPIYLDMLMGTSIYGNSPLFTYGYYTSPIYGAGTLISDATPTGTITWTGSPSVPIETSNIGTYSLYYGSGITLGNSSYNLFAGNAVNWTIAVAPLTVAGETTTTMYNGFAQTNTFSTSGIKGSDAVNTVTGLATGINYSVTPYADSLSAATGTGLSNYAITYTNGSLAIGQALLAVTGANNTVLYNGFAQTNTGASYSGQKSADSFMINGYATGIDYRATPYEDSLSVTGAALGNYTVSYTNGSLRINQAPLTVAGATTTTTYNGFAQTNTFSTSGIKGSDAVNTVTGLATGINYSVTPYADSLSAATGTGLSNYAITYTNGSLAIGQALLAVTGANNTVLYNGFAQTNTGASYSGQKSADSFMINGYATGIDYRATPYEDSLSVTGAALGNYTVSYTNGSLRINQAPLTVAGATTTTTYNGFAQTNTFSTSGIKGSDAVNTHGFLIKN